jgi:hypothetical protein
MTHAAKKVSPAARTRGADSHVPETPAKDKSSDAAERKLEQGLEESMAGSDPVSVTQPTPRTGPKKAAERRP